MNATTNFTVKSLRANKVRTLVTIAGVALAAALLTAVLTTYASLNDFLYRNEAALAGTWMACVEADGSSALDEKIADAQADSQVSGTAIMRDIGFAELTADQQDTQGTYLAIRSIEGDVGDICGIEPSEGRLPESDREIMLFALSLIHICARGRGGAPRRGAPGHRHGPARCEPRARPGRVRRLPGRRAVDRRGGGERGEELHGAHGRRGHRYRDGPRGYPGLHDYGCLLYTSGHDRARYALRRPGDVPGE